jgi:hypothetical protein
MFCAECGEAFKEEAGFCSGCGGRRPEPTALLEPTAVEKLSTSGVAPVASFKSTAATSNIAKYHVGQRVDGLGGGTISGWIAEITSNKKNATSGPGLLKIQEDPVQYTSPEPTTHSTPAEITPMEGLTIEVQIPLDKNPGDQLVVAAPDGRQMCVVVPDGVVPGGKIQVKFPAAYVIFISWRMAECKVEVKALQAALKNIGVIVIVIGELPGGDLLQAVTQGMGAADLFIVMGTETYGRQTSGIIDTYKEMQYIISSKKPFFLFNMNPEPSLMHFQEEAANIVFNLSTVAWERWAVGAPISPKVVDTILQKLNKRRPLCLLSEATSAADCMGKSRDVPSDIERVAMEIDSGIKQFISGLRTPNLGALPPAANTVPLLQKPNLGALPPGDMVQSKPISSVADCCMSLHVARRRNPCCCFCIVLSIMLIGGLILMGLVLKIYCDGTKSRARIQAGRGDYWTIWNATWCYRNHMRDGDDDGQN